MALSTVHCLCGVNVNDSSLIEPCPVSALQPSWEHRATFWGNGLSPAAAAGLACQVVVVKEACPGSGR